MKVCQKVESKGKTTYNEVADELVKEFALLKTPDMKVRRVARGVGLVSGSLFASGIVSQPHTMRRTFDAASTMR